MNECADSQALPAEWLERTRTATIQARIAPKPAHIDPRQIDMFEAPDLQPSLFDAHVQSR